MVPFQRIFVHFPGGGGWTVFFFGWISSFWYIKSCKKVSSISSISFILVFIPGRTSHKLTTKSQTFQGSAKTASKRRTKKGGFRGCTSPLCCREKDVESRFFCVFFFDQINATNCMLRKSCISLAWDFLTEFPSSLCLFWGAMDGSQMAHFPAKGGMDLNFSCQDRCKVYPGKIWFFLVMNNNSIVLWRLFC